MADDRVSSALASDSASSNIDISTPAVVGWGSSDTLSEVTFDARYLDSTNDAFFKLRSTVTLKATAPTKTPIFLFIHPERIKLLEVVEAEAAEPGEASRGVEVSKKFGSNTVCLRLLLSRPADLVGPKTSDLTPKNKASGVILDSLRSLARCDSLAVYIPQHVLSKARLASLCSAANSGLLKSIARQADLVSLYRGKGGQVIEEPDRVVDASTESDSPPSYDELGPGPPPAPLDEPGGSTPRPQCSTLLYASTH